MKTTHKTIVASWGAMALGLAFLLGTCFVLFNDVLNGAKVTGSHVMTALALLGATAAGHQIVVTFRERRWGLALGLTLLTAASLGYVATMSGARNAEQLVLKADVVKGANASRAEALARLQADLEHLEDMRSAARRECKTGNGPRCKGANENAAKAQAAADGSQARVDRLGTAETPNAGYRQAAEAVALLGISSRKVEELEKMLVVLMPWLAVLIAELGTIVFMSAALGHEVHQKPFPRMVSVPVVSQEKPREIEEIVPERKASNVVPFPAPKHSVISALERVGHSLSNEELAAAIGCSTAEASRRWREVAGELDVGRQGKRLVIGLKSWRKTA